MFEYIKHINVVTKDFARSMDFYQKKLGMRSVYGPFGVFGPEMAAVFGITNTNTESPLAAEIACFLRWSDDDTDTVLDLGWWLSPPAEGEAYRDPTNVGHQRLDFKVGDIDRVYQDLVRDGVAFNSPPVSVDLGREVRFCHFFDPDGVRLGLIQDSAAEASGPGFERIHCVSTCVRDLEASIGMYRDVLGMEVVLGPFALAGPQVAQAFGLPHGQDAHAVGAWLRPGKAAGTLFELIEWKTPPTSGEPYPLSTPEGHSFGNHVGIVRVAMWVDDLQGTYRELKERGARFITPPVVTDMGPDCGYCCFPNLDGTVLQLYKYVRADERTYGERSLGVWGEGAKYHTADAQL
jgi:catechol 2,3-dioxygenase-like lactoylglutathione lyase family enzyme